jgi:hypothetical protein
MVLVSPVELPTSNVRRRRKWSSDADFERDTRRMPTFQYVTKDDEVWSQADAASCEREGDTITLIDMLDVDGNRVDCYTVDIHDVVELPDT